MTPVVVLSLAVAVIPAAAYDGVRALVDRTLTSVSAAKIVLVDRAREQGEDERFEIRAASGGRVEIAANSVSAQAAGFGWYLRHVAKVDFFWEGDDPRPFALPEPLPSPSAPIVRSTADRERAVFNFCTFSYSLAFADRERWLREIDLLALYGVNLPLQIVGMEKVWQLTLLKLGWTPDETRAFLAGPSFQAWQLMTNLEGHGGPLPQSWIDRRAELGRELIARERELGMTPMLCGFTGYVPRSTREKFPAAKIALQKNAWGGLAGSTIWAGFPSSAQLDPLDPLFGRFAAAFYEAEREVLGGYGYYTADPFHESAPPSTDEKYLAEVGRSLAAALARHDPEGVICMQAWSLRMPILRALPRERTLVLDINGSRAAATDGFEGYPFVAGRIHNFGGNNAYPGGLKTLASNDLGRAKSPYPNCTGSGLFPEGIYNSPAYFSLALELPWYPGAVDAEAFLAELIERRYRVDAPTAAALAQAELGSFLGEREGWRQRGQLVAARPGLDNTYHEIHHDPQAVLALYRRLVLAAQAVKSREGRLPPGLNFDLADVGRMLMLDLSFPVIRAAVEAKGRGEAPKLEELRRYFDDFDALMATEPLYDLRTHLKAAARWGETEAERELYTFNQALQVTEWGPYSPTTLTGLADYAYRIYAGLISRYYAGRWLRFFDGGAAENAILLHEKRFISDPHRLDDYRPAFAAADALEASERILAVWGKQLEALKETEATELAAAMRVAAGKAEGEAGEKVLDWRLKEIKQHEKQCLKADVSRIFDGMTGTFEFSFRRTAGAAGQLDVQAVRILRDGVKVAEDVHPGTAGASSYQSRYRIVHREPVIGAKFTLEADVKSEWGGDAEGVLDCRRIGD